MKFLTGEQSDFIQDWIFSGENKLLPHYHEVAESALYHQLIEEFKKKYI